ncbi:MAG: guanylate kinase [Thermodesulfobacteriota bacterium]|nr:guanylate kinase [Thermodesulfobacteriota bacterium]
MKDKNQGNKEGRGLIFIVSAPSGTGKTTLVRKVMEELPGLRFSISYTTRPPRANERDGKDYYFVTQTVFKEMVEKDRFLEWAEVLGNYYGTARVNMEALASERADLILDIDTQGAKRVKEKIDQAILIYLLPPSMEALQERLMRRGLDSPERIQFRLAQAKRDMEEANWYHHIIINERFEEAVQELKAIIIAERHRKSGDLKT